MTPVPIWQPLVAAVVIAGLVRNWQLTLISTILLADWALLTWFCWYTGNDYYIPMFAITDYVAALVILLLVFRHSKSYQRLILLTYGFSFADYAFYIFYTHPKFLNSFGIQYTPNISWARYVWWWWLYYMALTQALVCLVYGSITGGRRFGNLVDHWRARYSWRDSSTHLGYSTVLA